MTTDTETRPPCACGAPAAACSWEGDTRRSWACSACHQAEAAPEARDGRLGLDSRAEIATAQAEIAHRCDGPITSYVLIARALEAAAQGRHGYEALANALDAELRERGYLVEGEDEIPGS